MQRLRKALSERGLMRYAYYAGFAGGVGAAVLILYGHAPAAALVAAVAGTLLWVSGVPLLLDPRVARGRRVLRVIKDWNGLMRQVVSPAERRWQTLAASLSELDPPASLAERHAEALATLRRRPGSEAGAAAAAAFSVNARVTVRALIDDAFALPAATPGAVAYASDLRRLWTNNEAASDRDYAQLAVHCDGALRRMRRLKPPAAMADDDERLLELMERYCAAVKQRNAAMADADRAGVQATTAKLETMSAEFTQLLRPWYDDERERWYGPE